MTTASVVKVSKSNNHNMGKDNCQQIELIEGHGVKDDAHAGKTVKHLYLVRKNPNAINYRQVHLIHEELLDELKSKGFDISAGQMGENITTRNIDLLNLPRNTILKIGRDATIEIKGLRNPCVQLDQIQKGLMKAVIEKTPEGKIIRKAGVMAVVLNGGLIKDGDQIELIYPAPPHDLLEPV